MAIMKNSLLAALVLASSTLAAPLGALSARDVQVQTFTDWVTVNELATVWVDGQGVAVSTEYPSGASAATTSAAAATATSATTTAAAATSTEAASSSLPSYSPAGFNTEPLTSSTAAPTTADVTTTSAAAAATTAEVTSAAVYSTAAADTTSTSTSVYSTSAVETTLATSAAYTSSTTTTSSSSTTSAAASATSSSSSSSGTCVGSDSDCVGDITHWDGGLGACGWTVDTSSDMQIALPHELMGTLSNGNPYCGKSLTIVGPSGNEVKATVGDKCMGCSGYAIDLTDILFETVAPSGDGRVSDIHWYFNE